MANNLADEAEVVLAIMKGARESARQEIVPLLRVAGSFLSRSFERALDGQEEENPRWEIWVRLQAELLWHFKHAPDQIDLAKDADWVAAERHLAFLMTHHVLSKDCDGSCDSGLVLHGERYLSMLSIHDLVQIGAHMRSLERSTPSTIEEQKDDYFAALDSLLNMVASRLRRPCKLASACPLSDIAAKSWPGEIAISEAGSALRPSGNDGLRQKLGSLHERWELSGRSGLSPIEDACGLLQPTSALKLATLCSAAATQDARRANATASRS